jgi:hypothetical protein
VSKVRRSTVVPIIYHVVPTSATNDDGMLYLKHVRHGLRMAPDFATVDLSLNPAVIADVVASRGTIKIIGYLHADKSWEDVFWIAQFEIALRFGCSVVRVTRPAESIDDISVRSFSCRMARKFPRNPWICNNTG